MQIQANGVSIVEFLEKGKLGRLAASESLAG